MVKSVLRSTTLSSYNWAVAVIEEVMVGEDKMIRFGGVKGGAACSIVLRGASMHVLDEANDRCMMRWQFCPRWPRRAASSTEVDAPKV